jgi:hypothetical protein
MLGHPQPRPTAAAIDNRLVLTQARRATSDAFVSGSFKAKIQRIFSARVQCRRFSLDVMISTAVGTGSVPTHTTSVSH